MKESIKNQPKQYLLLLAIFVLAMNLRAPITLLGPLTNEIKADLNISATVAGLITTLPVLAFAIISPFISRIGNRFGMKKVLFLSIVFLLIASIVRLFGGVNIFLIGTFFVGMSIAFANVLLPALIKMDFPLRIGYMTGLYTLFMNITAAIASGTSVPVSAGLGLGWKMTAGIWALVAFAALVLWIPQMLLKPEAPKVALKTETTPAVKVNMWKNPLAWSVTVFFGIQSLSFYSMVAWLPTMLSNNGMDPATAGWVLFVVQMAQIPASFGVALLSDRLKNQSSLVWIGGGAFFIGFSGLIYSISQQSFTFVWISAIAIGIAGGLTFGLSMMLYNLKTDTVREASDLAGMSQAVGYLFAAMGPTLFGLLHDVTGSWVSVLYVLLASVFVIVGFGLFASQHKKVSFYSNRKE